MRFLIIFFNTILVTLGFIAGCMGLILSLGFFLHGFWILGLIMFLALPFSITCLIYLMEYGPET